MRTPRHALWVVLLLLCPLAEAHEIRPAIASVDFHADGSYDVALQANLEAVLAGISPRHADTDESPNARAYDALRALDDLALAERIRAAAPALLAAIAVEWDGARTALNLSGVEVSPQPDLRLARLTTVRLAGIAPPGASTFTWAYPAEYGSCVLKLRRDGDARAHAEWLENGARSAPFRVDRGEPAAPVTAGATWRRYIELGFSHILPRGLDHILFVLGLFLLSVHWRPLLAQVTAFTIAHSITLGLAIYGVLALSPAIVEPLIALSIVYVAVENIVTTELKPWRVFVVFGFGLLHGLGFAGVLHEIGLPRSEFLTALIAFNVGVEFGQLAVITAAFLAVGLWFRRRTWYRARIVIPASAAIALTGLYWTVERSLLA